MEFRFVKMKKEYANEIAYDWKYPDKYSFYDMTEDEEDLNDLLDKKNWSNKYFAALNEDELVGFYSIRFEDEIMWIGLALKPELTGKGIGSNFVLSGLDFAISEFSYKKSHIMLAVLLDNQRAIKSYEKLGFVKTEEYMQKTNGSEFKFIKMKKDL